MTKTYRLLLLGFSFLLLVGLGHYIRHDFSFLLNDFWFTSGLLLLILLSLIDQPHFSKDTNVFVNAVTAAVSLLLVQAANRDFLFWTFLFFIVYLTASSYVLMWLRQNPLNEENKLVQFFSRLNRQIGRPEAIFSAFFLWGGIRQFGLDSNEFNLLLWFWIIFMIFNIPALAKTIEGLFETIIEKNDKEAIGQIFGVQSKNTFLVRLLESRTETTKVFDFVEFKYSIDNKIRKGLILDVYLLNQQQWIKVLSTPEIDSIFESKSIISKHTNDLVYKLVNIPVNNYLERFIGIVSDNSTIDKVRFVFNSKVQVSEGQLLEINIGKSKVLYQITEGITKIEQLENKNQTGFIVGEAIQLGTWNNEKLRFEQFGWVPDINTPIYLASVIEEPKIEDNEYIIGKIPNTNYPVVINKDFAISHHMAVVGVTGTGKSVFSRNLIRQYLADKDTKVICIDFTGEYIGKFEDLKPVNIIEAEVSEQLFKDIDYIEQQIADNYNKDNENSRKKKKEVSEIVNKQIEDFLKSEYNLSIFELPHVANTSGVLTYTKTFFRLLFHIAKTQKNFGKRICIVLEEAHTIIPEWNFSGVSEKISQPLLNSISQIALQGRKYNVGLLVIAQRTANVSKTILTQCNTIISFQEFDKTSSEFLSNYFGQEISKSLPKLKFRQAIVAGKALKSNVPMIFEVPELTS
jgi:hypothetical protein